MPGYIPSEAEEYGVPAGTSFPANPEEGQTFYRTDENELYIYDGTDWIRWEIEAHASEHESGGADEVLHDNLALDPTDHHTLPKTVNQGTVTLGDGETFTIWRATLPAGNAIKVIDAGIQPSGTTDLNIEVYNQTDAVSIYSNNASYDDGSYDAPLASGGTGDDVEIRLNNASGATQDCSGWVTFVVE